MGGGFKALNLVRPFLPFLPQVEGANKDTPFKVKMIFTVISLFIFLVCSQLPLYGIHSNPGLDPFYRIRLILASSRGTVMELGISPIVTSSMVVQLLVASNIFQVDYNLREDQELLNGAEKMLGILITVGEGTAYVLSGMYGDVSQLGVANSILVVVQLTFAGIIILCLDEILNNGYATINIGRGPEFQGAAIALIHLLVTRKDKVGALKEAFCRQNLPNVTNLLATLFIFLMIIYLQQFQVMVPLRSKNIRGQQGYYPIKLFYTSNMPIILHSAFVTNFTLSP
ncbi:Protein transport protein Sec61 subunit alpha, partial [Bienertia sinuspersici]